VAVGTVSNHLNGSVHVSPKTARKIDRAISRLGYRVHLGARSLRAQRSHSVGLVVPNLEKIGQLRQSARPEAGKLYWMAFSNKGRLVKRGDHIDVVIGGFKAQGLIVE